MQRPIVCIIATLLLIVHARPVWSAPLLTHGSNITISGSGFGTRTVVKDIFDDCTSASVSDLWNDATNYSYMTPAALGRGIPLPHGNITRYAVGNQTGGSGYNAWLSTYVTGLTYPTNLFCMSYRRVDPNWTFGALCDSGDGDNNYKFFTVSAGASWFVDPYWYHSTTNQKCTLSSDWQNNFYSSGGLGNLNTAYTGSQGGSSDSDYDLWTGWRKVEYRIGLGSSSQILKYLTNNKYYQNLTNQNTFNAGGKDGAFSIGTYSRQYGGANHYNYQADIVMVIGPDAFKRVILSNNATYTSSTIVEYQPVVSWSDTSITVKGNIGAIPNGTAYLHVFVDASDTPEQTTAVTIASTSPTMSGATCSGCSLNVP